MSISFKNPANEPEDLINKFGNKKQEEYSEKCKIYSHSVPVNAGQTINKGIDENIYSKKNTYIKIVL
jgi:hypothetical protein